MYANKLKESVFSFVANEIHVFDWEGRPVKRIILEKEFDTMALDQVNRKLYVKNGDEEIYCYDVSYLYN